MAAPPRPLSEGSAVAMRVLVIAAVLMLWVVGYLLYVSALQQERDQQKLYAQFREQLASMTAPIGGPIEPGRPVAMIDIPAIDIEDLVVVEGTSSGDLRAGPGHRRDTVLPGQPGVSVLFGRGAAFGAPFGDVERLRRGAVITVVTGQGEFAYKVIGLRRAGDPLPAPLSAGGSRLTLVTTDGSGWRTGWAPTGLLYADAELIGDPAGGVSGRLSAIPEAEKALQGDPGALVTLVLWLQLLGITAVAAFWVRVRWGNAQAWLLGVPTVLAVLWGTSSTAILMLPNLL